MSKTVKQKRAGNKKHRVDLLDKNLVVNTDGGKVKFESKKRKKYRNLEGIENI